MKHLFLALPLCLFGCASSGGLKLTVQCAGRPVLLAEAVAEMVKDVDVNLPSDLEDSMHCHIEVYRK